MNRVFAIIVFASFLLVSCSQSEKMKRFNSFKSEINKDLIHEFEKHLPFSYDHSYMAKIRYAANYSAFGLAGVSVLYQLDESEFHKQRDSLLNKSIVPLKSYIDSIAVESSNSEFSTMTVENKIIAVPNVDIDFCHYGDTCLTWQDLEIVLLEYGQTEAFSEAITDSPELVGISSNYSIGAICSQDKKEIIYWIFI